MRLYKDLSPARKLYIPKEKTWVNRYGCLIKRAHIGVMTRTLGVISKYDVGKRFIVDQYLSGKIKEYMQ